MSRPARSPVGRHLRLSGLAAVGLLLACVGAGWVVSAGAQSASQAGAPPPASPSASAATTLFATQTAANAPEMSTHDNPLPLESRVNLVPVRVVVRDSNGNAIANLHREDFQLFEDGKPQIVSNFTVETLASLSGGAAGASPTESKTGAADAGTGPGLPASRAIRGAAFR